MAPEVAQTNDVLHTAKPGEIHHTILEVADLARASAFYAKVLGLRDAGRDIWPEERPTASLETGGGDWIVLVEEPSRRPPWPGECLYLTLEPDEWRDVHRRVADAGCHQPPDPNGGLRGAGELRFRVSDPDDHVLELHAFEPAFYETPAAGRGKIRAGRIDDFPVGSVTRVPEGRFYLVRLDGGFVCLSEVCTHRQFTVRYQPERHRFACPLHGNRYSRTGRLIHRGARSDTPPLCAYPIAFVDGMVVVDTDVLLPRGPEEADQLVPAPGGPLPPFS